MVRDYAITTKELRPTALDVSAMIINVGGRLIDLNDLCIAVELTDDNGVDVLEITLGSDEEFTLYGEDARILKGAIARIVDEKGG